jgi:UDP-N-acetylglucosamine 3-dehydrogenase
MIGPNFVSGSSGVMDTNWLAHDKLRSLVVIAPKAIAEVNCIEQTLKIFDQERVRDAKIEKEEPSEVELLRLVDCGESDREPLVSRKEGDMSSRLRLLQLNLPGLEE